MSNSAPPPHGDRHTWKAPGHVLATFITLNPVTVTPILFMRPSNGAFAEESVKHGGRDRSEVGPEARARPISPWEGFRETGPGLFRGSHTGSRGTPSFSGSQQSSEPLRGKWKMFPVSDTSESSAREPSVEPRSSHGRHSFPPIF